jgi:hypothetical protein
MSGADIGSEVLGTEAINPVGNDDVGGAKSKRWRRGDLAGGQGLWAVTKLGGSGAVAVLQITMPLYRSWPNARPSLFALQIPGKSGINAPDRGHLYRRYTGTDTGALPNRALIIWQLVFLHTYSLINRHPPFYKTTKISGYNSFRF